MGRLRLWRRVRIAPGVTLNVSKRGISTSLGVRGAHATFGRHGMRRTVGIPGTGLFYTSYSAHHARTAARRRPARQTGRPVRSTSSGSTIVELFHKPPLAKIGYGFLLTLLVVTSPIGIPLLLVGIAQLLFSTRWRARGLITRAERAADPAAGQPLLDRALATRADDPVVLARSAAWHEAHEQWASAASLYARYLTAAPADIPARGHYARCLLGDGHPDQAIEQFLYVRRAPLEDESRASVTSFLAIAWLSKADASQALAFLKEEPLQRRALGLGLQQCLYLRGVCQYLVGQRARGIADLERLYVLNAAFPDVLIDKAAMQAGTFSMPTPCGRMTAAGLVPDALPVRQTPAP